MLQVISLISYLSKKKKKENDEIQFYYSSQKYDHSVTTYFRFSKREFPEKSHVVFT